MATPEEQKAAVEQLLDNPTGASAATEVPTPADGVATPSPVVAAIAEANAKALEQAGAQSAPAEEAPATDEAAPAADDTPAPAAEEVKDVDLAKQARTQFEVPAAWSDEQVLAWVNQQTVDQPVKNADGVFYLDPTRASRAVPEWSTPELLAFLKGELKDVTDKLNGPVVNEFRKREDVPQAWSVKEVIAFYGQGIEPEKTRNGVWKNDVTRAERQASDWSTEELHAWAFGEIRALGKTNDAKAASELKSRVKLTSENNSPDAVRAAYTKQQTQQEAAAASQAEATSRQAPEPAPAQAAPTPKPLDTVEGLTPMNVSFIDSSLARYEAAVKPGSSVDEAAALRAQNNLENLFQYIIALEPSALVPALKRLLDYFSTHQEKGQVFHADNVYRFTHLMRTERKYRERHINFLEVLRAYSAPNKDLRKQVDVRTLVRDQQPDRVEMLVEFFQKHA
jgi:hypothetical protein